MPKKTIQKAYSLKKSLEMDNKLRKFLQNPWKIVSKYLKKDYIILDFGCGPGLFSFDIAMHLEDLKGKGKVIAADIDKQMLKKLKNKISGLKIQKRIKIHECKKNEIGLNKKVDFVLAFYVLHELPSKNNFFKEIRKILKPKSKILIAEPVFHVSKKDFEKTIKIAKKHKFKVLEKPKIFMSRSVVLE